MKRLHKRRLEEGADLLELSQSTQQLGDHGMNGSLHGSLVPFAASMEQLAGVTKRQAEEDKLCSLLTALKLYKQLCVALLEQFKRRTDLCAWPVVAAARRVGSATSIARCEQGESSRFRRVWWDAHFGCMHLRTHFVCVLPVEERVPLPTSLWIPLPFGCS